MSEELWELPEGWRLCRLKEVADLCLGKMLDQSKNRGVPQRYLRNINVRWGTFDLTDLKEMRFEADEVERYSVRSGDVVVCEGGEPGRCAVWRSAEPMFIQKALHRVRCGPRLVPEFLAAQIRLSAVRGSLDRHFTGSTIKHLTGSALAEYPVLLPPLAEQAKIVDALAQMLARTRRAREALADVPTLLTQLRQSILAAAFRGDLTAAWREAHPNVEPASALLERIRQERRRRWMEANPRKKYVEPEPVDPEAEGLPELPAGWVWGRLEELTWDGPTNGYSGPTSPSAEGTLTLKLSATTSGEFVLTSDTSKRLAEVIAEDSPLWLRPGDLLIQRANSLELVGSSAIFRGHSEPLVYPDLMMRVRPVYAEVGTWLWRFLNSVSARKYFMANATGTAGNMPKINAGVVRELRVPIAPRDEMDAALRGIHAALVHLARLEQHHVSLRSELDASERGVLAKAFRGELTNPIPFSTAGAAND